jgi:hypothetical protein
VDQPSPMSTFHQQEPCILHSSRVISRPPLPPSLVTQKCQAVGELFTGDGSLILIYRNLIRLCIANLAGPRVFPCRLRKKRMAHLCFRPGLFFPVIAIRLVEQCVMSGKESLSIGDQLFGLLVRSGLKRFGVKRFWRLSKECRNSEACMIRETCRERKD